MTTGSIIALDTREEWLAARNHGIGASEVAALFGIQPESRISRYELWAYKVGIIPPEPFDEEFLFWGSVLEEPIAKRYAFRTGRVVTDPGPFTIWRHATRPYMFATLDRLVEDKDLGSGLLQIKNVGTFMEHEWKDGVPDYIEAQVQQELACSGLAWASVAILVGGNRLGYYDIKRNEEFIAELELTCEEFWGLVERKEAPEIDASPRTAKLLKRLHPKDSGATVELPPESLAWDEEYVRLDAEAAALKAKLKEIESDQQLLENRIMEAMGDATFGQLPGSVQTYSWRYGERAGFTVAPKSTRTFKRVSIKLPGQKKAKRASKRACLPEPEVINGTVESTGESGTPG